MVPSIIRITSTFCSTERPYLPKCCSLDCKLSGNGCGFYYLFTILSMIITDIELSSNVYHLLTITKFIMTETVCHYSSFISFKMSLICVWIMCKYYALIKHGAFTYNWLNNKGIWVYGIITANTFDMHQYLALLKCQCATYRCTL